MATSLLIEALRKAFPAEQVILQGTGEYEKLNGSYLSALESDIKPTAICQPKSKEEVSTFVKTIKPFAASGETLFAIRGAGRQPVPGCANIQDGITLDLGLLTGIELKSETVSIAAGERWEAIYEKLEGEGLAVTGNRSNKGGIGGLALQGGLSVFSSREGFVCDNVVNYEIVLADGSIVNANAKENSDLWIALKGGANNFGIVTRFDMRTFKQGPFWGGSVFYFEPTFPSQIEALVKELHKRDASDETHLMISIGYTAQFGQTMCMNQVYYTQAVEKPAVLEPFTEIQPQLDALNSMRVMGLKDSAKEQAADTPGFQRCAYMNTTVNADVATLLAATNEYTSAIGPIKPVEGLVCSLTLQPYPTSLLKKSASLGGNSLGLDPAEGPLVSVLLLTYWKNKSDDEQVLKVMRDILEKGDKISLSKGTAVDFKYLNYAFTFQDPIGSYGVENKQKLREASKKYDPEGLFQKGCPGGFKLFT
ncbi:hypothetical protein FQN49_003243 [Arthroderma sp. PD_2]|nr:hypothetical protein FQN49_003243 [Arthroderma sp. PD_2]